MRKIFYVPKSKDYMDYESEWKGVTALIQTGLSESIEQFVNNPEVAQMVKFIEESTRGIIRQVAGEEVNVAALTINMVIDGDSHWYRSR